MNILTEAMKVSGLKEWGNYIKGFYHRFAVKDDNSDELIRVPYFSKIRPIDISSKEAYLKWVDEWKGWWKHTSREIRYHRERKAHYRNRGREVNKEILSKGAYLYRVEERDNCYGRMWYHHDSAERLSKQARELHELRLEGKRRSYEQKMKEQS